MTKCPLVSVITPCYNAEIFIDDCIQSVLSQTYQNWELLVIDDCSTDSTMRKILDYSKKDKRIKCFKTIKTSGGPAHPRNIGLSNASGAFVAFLDADDMWLPNKLEEQVKFIIDHDLQFIYSNYEKISAEGKRSGRILRMSSVVTYDHLLKTCEIPCLTTLIRSSLVTNNLFKEVGKEDYLLWLQILKKGVTAFNTNKVHALYRQQTKSRSSEKIKMLYEQWVILRDFQKLSLIKALYCWFYYIYRGIQKYIR